MAEVLPVNMMKLTLSDRMLSLVREVPATVEPKVSAGVDEKLQTAVHRILTDKYTRIVVSNKLSSSGKPANSFSLQIDKKGLQLILRRSIQVLKYAYAYNGHKLFLNGEQKDRSHREDFLNKIDVIAEKIKLKQVRIEGRKSQ